MTRGELRAASVVAVLAVSPGCADILGLPEAIGSPAFCRADSECAQDESCQLSHCLSVRCSARLDQNRCSGQTPVECAADGTWQPIAPACPSMCHQGECVAAPSCRDLARCQEGVSCCSTITLEAVLGFDVLYLRPSDGVDMPQLVKRSVRSFALDRFEVTARRFSEFFFRYDAEGRTPAPGSGSHPAYPDSGWQASWSDDPELMPEDQTSLGKVIRQAGQDLGKDLTVDSGRQPVRGVNWYLAMAFCIWDGGRLPSEAEWYLAASAGQASVYPWSSVAAIPPGPSLAEFSTPERTLSEPARVGEHTDGKGIHGHEDLAGNLSEWMADRYEQDLEKDCLLTPAQLDELECVHLSENGQRVARGGSFQQDASRLRNAARAGLRADSSVTDLGFRCARDLPNQ